jgi:hypothetical protein
LSSQVSQNFSHIPVFLRLSGRRKRSLIMSISPNQQIRPDNAVEGFEFPLRPGARNTRFRCFAPLYRKAACPGRPWRSRDLGRWAEPEPDQRLRRQQCDVVVAGRAIDLYQVTGAAVRASGAADAGEGRAVVSVKWRGQGQ